MQSAQSAFKVIDSIESIACGQEAAKHFAFGNGYKNLNHGRDTISSHD